jgi:hypothetical protein
VRINIKEIVFSENEVKEALIYTLQKRNNFELNASDFNLTVDMKINAFTSDEFRGIKLIVK